ncbi:MAG: MaoC family dehydratase N-terminal domain-containing protein [Xanthobacteraceae bacterium]
MLNKAQHDYSAWIGREERITEELSPFPVTAALATLDDEKRKLGPGDPLPPLWHWFYFLPRVAASHIGKDGHPERGGFLPPVALPRRMFAGARLHFPHPLVIGKPASRTGTVRDISQKHGASGALVFVTVEYRIEQDGRVCVEEVQDIVYREPGARIAAPKAVELPAPPAGAWTRTITPNPILLCRFSALTFNAHRIHYDRPYATNEEGYPGLVVHGPLTAVLLLDLVHRHSNRPVIAYSFRGRAPLFDLAPFRLTGQLENDAVGLEAIGPDGGVAMTATATLGDT